MHGDRVPSRCRGRKPVCTLHAENSTAEPVGSARAAQTAESYSSWCRRRDVRIKVPAHPASDAEGREGSWSPVSPCKGSNCVTGPPPWPPNPLPKSQPPNTIAPGVRASTCEFGRDANIRSLVLVMARLEDTPAWCHPCSRGHRGLRYSEGLPGRAATCAPLSSPASVKTPAPLWVLPPHIFWGEGRHCICLENVVFSATAILPSMFPVLRLVPVAPSSPTSRASHGDRWSAAQTWGLPTPPPAEEEEPSVAPPSLCTLQKCPK